MKKLVAGVLFSAITIASLLRLTINTSPELDDSEDKISLKKDDFTLQKNFEKKSDKDNFNRNPSSIDNSEQQQSSRIKQRNESLFKNKNVDSNVPEYTYGGQNSNNSNDSLADSDQDLNTSVGGSGSFMPDQSVSPTQVNEDYSIDSSKRNPASDSPEKVAVIGSGLKTKTEDETTKNESSDTSTSGSSNTGTNQASTTLECDADIVNGTFNQPIAVSISCQATSVIKYCLAKGECCDPATNGSIYSSPVVIGKENTNYCLSYYGESETSGDSSLKQHSYQFNHIVPNLLVYQPKTYYQTTELVTMNIVTSSDFGKPNHSLGQLNLRTHNPDPTDENISCEEIVTNHSALTSPVPIMTQILMDVAFLTQSQQVEIPLLPFHLDYKMDNYIVSYIINNDSIAPLYACSTSRLIVEDFDFFTTDSIQADAGTNYVREFSAGFTSFGFFESDELNLNRAPAGASTEAISSQSLESGLFDIFY